MTVANRKTLYSETPEYFLNPEVLITVKEDEMIESMKHAALLQQCIFGTPEDFVAKLGFDSFIIYLPKDIVSGDFYWSCRIQDKIIIIVGDCTGHGVSGAMLTVFAQGAFNKVISENQNTNPAEILHAVDKELKTTFSRGSNSHGHGMDVSACTFDTRTRVLEFAGSGNPLWVIRDNTIVEFAGDIIGIGSNMGEEHRFRYNKFLLQENDMLYMLTDGYQDQFGGDFPGRPDGKKFMRKRLKQMLLTIAHLSVQDQKKILEITLQEWKQGLDQVDDICILGMSI